MSNTYKGGPNTMRIGPYDFPDDLYYDREHNWARVEGDQLVQGFTAFGQAIAGEILYVEPPRAGRIVRQGEAIMSVESGKWVGRIRALAGGRIEEGNAALEAEPSLINRDPYGRGWMARLTISNAAELDNLLRASDPAFAAFMGEERAKYNK
jgi:glycine cleavage system H protein